MWYVNQKLRTDVQGSVLKHHTHPTISLGDICKKHRPSAAEMHSSNKNNVYKTTKISFK